MDYTTLTLSTRAKHPPEMVPAASLYHTLQALSDKRRKQGKRYELALVLSLIVLAKLAGQQTLSGATDWIRHHGVPLAQRFGLRRQQMPCQMTYCNVLAMVDSKHLDELLSAFFIRWEAQARCGEQSSRLLIPSLQTNHAHVAVDGKALRATSNEVHPVHQLSCYEVATGIVLWHCNVQEKENEISALKPLLAPSWVSGRILTLDALHTQRDLCAQIHRLRGDYLLIAKDNQPTLQEDIADLFEDAFPDRRRWKQAETWDKGHGRLEHRQLLSSPDLNDWFRKDWEGIEQVFRLERTTRILKTGKLRHEVVYGLSSLSMSKAPPQRMLQLARDHWAIENRLHHRRDVTLGEDRCQTRTGSVPSLLAQLNSAVLSLMDRLGVRNVARQMRYLNAHVDQALDLILLGQCSVY
ncbi:ISAs1 family transposase [Ktedonobacter robiniae]|uniref:ISAs1 family transposase n=1 Tax=Ktedonobacter robiniae TaxID=2778365 RepID=A0ABQ3USX2_9CHLR|nr:ISAs1 family transposase [Ktedonobacter robiniae]GHO55755.1 ISAs1 family transposase [Ktedonobacter robiniae]GHO56402.1 ISAs1 family transposase [Ktedonobacter robiniae]